MRTIRIFGLTKTDAGAGDRNSIRDQISKAIREVTIINFSVTVGKSTETRRFNVEIELIAGSECQYPGLEALKVIVHLEKCDLIVTGVFDAHLVAAWVGSATFATWIIRERYTSIFRDELQFRTNEFEVWFPI